MFCPNCGEEIDDESKFCKHCGNSITSTNNEITELEAAEVTEDNETEIINTNDTQTKRQRRTFNTKQNTKKEDTQTTKSKKNFPWKIIGGCCLGIFILCIISIVVEVISMDNDTSEIRELSQKYDSYDNYYHGFLHIAIPNNNTTDNSTVNSVHKYAIIAAHDMNKDGKSIKEITHALNEPARQLNDSLDTPSNIWNESDISSMLKIYNQTQTKAQKMHNNGKSIKEITHALNKDSNISTNFWDEEDIEQMINE